MPKCRNCRIRGHICETSDPKNPELVVVRKGSSMDQMQEHGDFYNWYQQQQASKPANHQELNSTAPPFEVEQRQSQKDFGPVAAPPHASAHEHEDGDFDFRSPPRPELQLQSRPLSWLARSYSDNLGTTKPRLDMWRAETIATSEPTPEKLSHHSPDMAVNTDGSKHRRKLMGGSSLQSLSMFLDLYLERQGLAKIGPLFRHGMHHAEEFILPITVTLPDLPPPSVLDAYLRTFFERIHPLFPLLDVDHFQADVARLRSYQDSQWSPNSGLGDLRTLLKPSDIPVLTCIYSIISLAADETAATVTEIGTNFLGAAYSMYGHLVGQPYLPSVQALLLLTLCFRGRSKEGQGFQTLGQAIRIAHSIGLHRYISSEVSTQGMQQSSTKWSCEKEPEVGLGTRKKHDTALLVIAPSGTPAQVTNAHNIETELNARVWWTCYSLEKLVELETARPSAVRQSDSDQILPPYPAADGVDYYSHWVSLSKIMGQISDLLYRTKRNNQRALQLLQSIGTVDKALTDWSQTLPESIRPGHELFCDDAHFHIASYLHLQYHQAMITLHRASLVFPANALLKEIDTYTAELPWHQRLRKGMHICVSSARSTVKLNNELADRGIESRIFTGTQPMLACMVLGLNIVKAPTSRGVRSDLELLISSSQYAEDEWREDGQDATFIQTCIVARQSMTLFVERMQAAQSSNSARRAPAHTTQRLSQPMTPDSDNRQSASVISDSNSWHTRNASAPEASSTAGMDTLALEDPLKDIALEDFWSFLGDDSAAGGFSMGEFEL